MAKKVYENSRLYVNGYRVSGWVNSWTLDTEMSSGEVKNFDSQGWMELVRGGRAWSNSYEGYIDGLTNPAHLDAVMHTSCLIEEVMIPEGADIQGSKCVYLMGFNESTGYELNTDDPGAVSIEINGTGRFKAGTVMNGQTTLTADGELAVLDLGAPSVDPLTIVVNCPAILGAVKLVDITLEESSDNSNWTPLGTFASLTNPGLRKLLVSGSERYLRLSVDLGPSTTSATIHASVYK